MLLKHLILLTTNLKKLVSNNQFKKYLYIIKFADFEKYVSVNLKSKGFSSKLGENLYDVVLYFDLNEPKKTLKLLDSIRTKLYMFKNVNIFLENIDDEPPFKYAITIANVSDNNFYLIYNKIKELLTSNKFEFLTTDFGQNTLYKGIYR